MQTNPPSVGKINRAILRLALPAIFSNITVPLLGLSDTFISGHLGAERYLAAIAAGTVLVNSLYWLFGFLRMGTTGLTADAFGRNDLLLRRRVFTMSFLLAFSLGLLLMILSVPLSRMLLWIMEPELDSILNGRTLIVVYLSTYNLILIVNSNENVTSSCISKAGNLIRDFLYLRGYTALEVYIVAFSSFYKF